MSLFCTHLFIALLRYHSVVDEDLFARHSSPLTLFHIVRRIIWSVFITERLYCSRKFSLTLRTVSVFCLICFSFAVDSGSLFSRSLINRRPSPAASLLGVRSCGYIAHFDMFDGVLNQFKANVFLLQRWSGYQR